MLAGRIDAHMSQVAAIQNQFQQVRSRFNQLGRDLQSGDLKAAQDDVVTLSQTLGNPVNKPSPVARFLNVIGQALQAGNLTAASQVFSSFWPTPVPPNAIGVNPQPPSSTGISKK